MFLVYYIAYDRSLGAGEGGPYTPLSFGLRRKYFCLTISENKCPGEAAALKNSLGHCISKTMYRT